MTTLRIWGKAEGTTSVVKPSACSTSCVCVVISKARTAVCSDRFLSCDKSQSSGRATLKPVLTEPLLFAQSALRVMFRNNGTHLKEGCAVCVFSLQSSYMPSHCLDVGRHKWVIPSPRSMAFHSPGSDKVQSSTQCPIFLMFNITDNDASEIILVLLHEVIEFLKDIMALLLV